MPRGVYSRKPECIKIDEPTCLSPRMVQLAIYLADGLGYKEISQHLGISLSTVYTHTLKLRCRLGVHSKLEVVREICLRGIYQHVKESCTPETLLSRAI